MAKQHINVGATPNDGLGDPIRTAYIKCNDNFDELYAGTNISGISNGTSNVNISTVNGNVIVGITGTSNVAVFAPTGEYVTGLLSATGNIIGGNVLTGGLISAAATVTGGNLATGGTASAAGNVTGGNVLTGGLISATGNITGGNVLTDGNVYTSYGLFATGTDLALLTTTASANITIGKVTTGGDILIGSNLVATGTHAFGRSAGTYTVNLGNGTINSNKIRTINLGTVPTTAGTSSAVNITIGPANVNTVGTVVFASATTLSVANTSGSAFSVAGNITGGNIITAGIFTVNSGGAVTAIVNGGSNAVGNIGSSGGYFNRLFAQSTSAIYSDLAENYQADNSYELGTVISFGGTKEVTISQQDLDPKIAGVISSNPAYLMNSGLVGEHVATIALTGRVSCMVYGNVTKGDMMVSAGNGRARSELNPTMGTVIGKSLEDFTGELGLIEVVVGRL